MVRVMTVALRYAEIAKNLKRIVYKRLYRLYYLFLIPMFNSVRSQKAGWCILNFTSYVRISTNQHFIPKFKPHFLNKRWK
jgi:hypothetical protein